MSDIKLFVESNTAFSNRKHHLQCLWKKVENSPVVVNTDIVRSVYRFNRPTCPFGNCQTTCKYLSSCLNGLLKLNVLDEETCDKTISDSTVETILTHSRNGLKNYGSTCYLNAFLQLYFRFKELRKAIYDVASQADETGIIHQLQLIFSQLQLNNSGIVDPGGLIEALRLCDTEQQDAPEFHCLFMNLLEARFQQVGVSIIDDLIRGEYIYETSCLKCGFTSRLPSKFLELSLKVSSKSLPDCIRDYLKEEQLVGDNRYACSQCGCKRDGIRRAYITRAPPLLCIQLLRFTYNSNTGQRKKYKASIRLPDVLELTRIVENSKSNKHLNGENSVECLSVDSDPCYRAYRLCGVLLHIGNQPTSGHYIAVLRDSYKKINLSQDNTESCTEDDPLLKSNECWSVCNDMDVFSIPSNQFKLEKINGSAKSLQSYLTSTETSDSSLNITKSDQSLEKCSSRRPAKKRRHDTSANDLDLSSSDLNESNDFTTSKCCCSSSQNELWYSSTNAYMIFYESMDNCIMDKDIIVPDELRQTIEEVNLIEQQKHLFEQRNKVNHKNQLLQILSSLKLPDPISLSPNNNDSPTLVNLYNDVSLISTSWLCDCLNHPMLLGDPCLTDAQIISLSKLKDYIFPASLPNQSSYSLRTCPHGHAPTDLAAGSYRAVSTEGLKKLIEILFPKSLDAVQFENTSFNQFQPCLKCISLNIALLKVENSIKELSKELDYFIRTNRLSSSYYKRLQNEEVNSISSSNNDKEPGYYLIGKKSLRQWKTLARHFTRSLYSDCDDEDDDDNNSNSPTTNPPPHHTKTAFNHDILCSHGQLCIENARYLPAILWYKLIDLFPNVKIPTFPVYIPYSNNNNNNNTDLSSSSIDSLNMLNKSEPSCSECNALLNDLSKRALCERQMLPSLFLSNVQRMRLLHSPNQIENLTVNIKDVLNKDGLNCEKGEDNFKSEDSYTRPVHANNNELNHFNTNAIYLIPMDFIIQWRKFIRNPTSDNLPSSLLSGFSTDGVLCEHGQMLKSWEALINESTLCPVTFYEWDVLSHAYPHRLKENEVPLDNDGLESKITSYPTMYLLPQTDSELKWKLEPSSYSTVCPDCHSELTTSDYVYNHARIRIHLVTGFDEALSNCVQSKPTTIHGSLNCVSQDSQTDTEICCQPATDITEPDNFDQEMNNLKEIKDYFNKQCHNTELYNSTNKNTTSTLSSNNGTSLIDQLPPSSSSSSDHQQQQQQQQQHILYDNTNILSSNQSRHSQSPSTNYVRRSTRQRLNPKDLLIKVNSSDTLLSVKLQLMQILGIIPSDQHIMSSGVELVDHTKTLQELGIHSKQILYLWSDDPTWDPNRISFDNGLFKLTTQKSKSNSPCKSTSESIPIESGFKGTRLLEF
ncbi:unnamed protein product [Schistosoma turkestanicum]|nr:unnamed protein product [Schistosoma turkestanicum]